MRLSLAGAQDKLPVVVAEGQIGLARFGTPSTHILKPAIPDVEGSVFNEGFCMSLARSCGLDAAAVQIRKVRDQHCLLVQRYDRLVPERGDGMPAQRLHQEDFCQALGVPPELKYQSEGGPDLPQSFELLRSATRPSAPHVIKLLDFVLFNVLVGNHDAHAKNFSLLYKGRTAMLASLYDVLCTAAYPGLTDRMAMKIGSKYRFEDLHARHWAQFAASASLSPAQVKKALKGFATRLPDQARRQRVLYVEQGLDHPVIDRIVGIIEERCANTLRRLTLSSDDKADDDEGTEG